MQKFSLTLLMVLAIGISDVLCRSPPRRPEPSRATHCRQKYNPELKCKISEKPLIGILAGDQTQSTPSEFLTALRNSGFDQLCQEIEEVYQCAMGLAQDALRDCEDVFGREIRESLPQIQIVHSFVQELCSEKFGDFDEHIDCFTNEELLISSVQCLSEIDIEPDRVRVDAFIKCVHNQMDQYPRICNRGAKTIVDKISRRAAELASQLIRDSGPAFPEEYFLTKLFQF